MDCCFIIPLHPKHYAYAYNFVNKASDIVDIFFVFSNENDYNDFEIREGFLPIIIPTEYPIGSSIITEKKFYALHQLKNSKYDFIIACDAEIDIISENFTRENILNKVENIFQNKYIYGGNHDSSFVKDISVVSGNVFCENDLKKLCEITDNFNYYVWWSNLPVYKRSHLDHFFSVIRSYNLSWYNFDHIMYSYYLLLYQDFHLINITERIGRCFSLESYCDDNEDNLMKLLEVKYEFGWVIPTFFKIKKDFLLKQGTFLLYHLDHPINN